MPTTALFRGSATDARDAAYRDALDALSRLHQRRSQVSGSTDELARLDGIRGRLIDLARGF
jgi:hypothetical protein